MTASAARRRPTVRDFLEAVGGWLALLHIAATNVVTLAKVLRWPVAAYLIVCGVVAHIAAVVLLVLLAHYR